METPEQRHQRIAKLEADRAERRAQFGIWPTPDDSGFGVTPVEIAPGRGDLSYTSGFAPVIPTALQLVGPYVVSFARIYMSQPWVAAAVMRMLTWSIRCPLTVYRGNPGDPNDKTVVQPDEHPLAAAVSSPWPRGSQADLVMSLLGPQLVYGNAVMQVESGAANAVRFRPQDWRFCRPIMPFRQSIDGWIFNVDQPAFAQNASVDEVLHTRYWSPIQPIGCSPLQQLGVTLQIEDAAQRYQRASLANAARLGGMVTASMEFLGMDRRERMLLLKQLREDITNLYTGPENAGKPLLLPPGLEWAPAGQTTVEAELVHQRTLTREEIAAVYMIPPPLIGQLEHATFSNIAVQRDMIWTDCMGPPLVLIEQQFNSQVVQGYLQDDAVFVQFDFSKVLRGDRLQEIESLRQAIGMALLTPNEGRGVLDQPKSPLPEMDKFYIPSINQLQPIDAPAAVVPQLPPGPPERVPRQPAPVGANGHARGQRLIVVAGGKEYELVS